MITFKFLILQFAFLETSSVDDDLANLKKELSGRMKVVYPNFSLLSVFLEDFSFSPCNLFFSHEKLLYWEIYHWFDWQQKILWIWILVCGHCLMITFVNIHVLFFGEQKGEVRAGRTATVASTGSALRFQDPEIENELNQLRQKAQEY